MTVGTQETAVGDLEPATWRDLPALALVAGRASARRAFGNRAGHAWLADVVGARRGAPPALWHLDRRGPVAIYPPGASKRSTEVFMVPLASGAASGVTVATIGVPALASMLAIIAAFVIALAGPYHGRLRAGRTQPRRGQRLHIALAAAIGPRTGLLRATSAHLVARYRGELIDLAARDRDVADVYIRRWGLRAVDPERGRMMGVVPTR
jgi:hypothetical protein